MGSHHGLCRLENGAPAAKRQKNEVEKWVVIGYHGFIGRAVVQCLRAAQLHVYGIAHNQLGDLELTLRQHRIAGVVNCAGLCRGSKEEVWASQVDLVSRLVKLCTAHGGESAPRFVQISTERVYGWAKHPSVASGQMDPAEEWSVEVEKVLLAGYPNDRLTLLRPANVYGPGARIRYNSAIATWVDLALKGENLVVHGDGHRRNFIYIEDLKTVVRTVCTRPRREDACAWAIDVRPLQSDSITMPASIIAKLCEVELTVPEGSQGESEPALTSTWTLKAQNALQNGILTKLTTLEQGLKATIAHEKAARETMERHKLVSLPTVDGDRGRMVELFGPGSQRMYEIVVEPGYVRGNHYHQEQYEEFYVSEGACVFELQPGAPEYMPEAMAVHHLDTHKRQKLQVPPLFQHTVWNPSPLHPALVLVSSTQKYIPNCSPDTYWPQNSKK